MIKITNNTFAIHAAVPAMNPNPRTAAIMATTRNMTAQLSWPFLFIIYILEKWIININGVDFYTSRTTIASHIPDFFFSTDISA